jgi:2,3-bisphosphoglycerate-dependent phosphoglycerate mutase
MSEAVPQPSLLATRDFATELLLIRHGRSADVVPGSEESLDPPLHEVGRTQAEALAKRLANKQIDAIYSSDLKRAVETATPLAASRGINVVQRKELREVWLGDWERGEFRRRAAALDPEWLEFARSGLWDKVPGSEGDVAFRKRVQTTIDELVAAHDGQTIAVVCHGGVINGYLAATYNLDVSYFATIENSSITLLRSAKDFRRMLVTVNDCHHLYDPVTAAPHP